MTPPLRGALRSWNDERGFGFIAPAQGGADVFVHASAFARDGTRPTVGERVSYELGAGRDGKPQAVNVVRLALGEHRPAAGAPHRKAWAPEPARGSWVGSVLGLALVAAVVGGVGTYGYKHFAAARARSALAQRPAHSTPAPLATDAGGSASFRCDGRIHCSQMTSCAEATWFINHCPGTKMDGNNDGVPCEQQWCTSPLAK